MSQVSVDNLSKPCTGTEVGAKRALDVYIVESTTDADVLERTTGQESPAITDNAQVTYDVSAAVLVAPTHITPVDGKATFTSSTSITCSDFPFTVDDANNYVTHIDYFPSGSTFSKRLINGVNGVSMKAAANVITVAGAGTPFAASDTYVVGIRDQNKAHNASNNAQEVGVINGPSTNYFADELVNDTNLSATTHDYEFNMDGVTDFSLDLKMVDADGTITTKVYMKNDGGTYDQVYGYDDTLDSVQNSWTVTNSTLTSKISFNKAVYDDVKVEIVCSGATNTVVAIIKRKY